MLASFSAASLIVSAESANVSKQRLASEFIQSPKVFSCSIRVTVESGYCVGSSNTRRLPAKAKDENKMQTVIKYKNK